MSAWNRHKTRQNIRFSTRYASDDDFQDVPHQHFFHHTAATSANERIDNVSNMQHSTTVLNALSDPKSELARYLFISNTGPDAPNCPDDGDNMKSMGSRVAWLYSLVLAPVEIRNERVIMVAEAYSIFGALFLSGTWILYEWGSSKANGETERDEFLSRFFELVMANAIICNLLLASFGSLLWMMSLVANWESEDWCYKIRKLLTFCDSLLALTGGLVVFGIVLGILSNLRGHWPEIIISTIFYFVLTAVGVYYMVEFMLSALPLEIYHLPFWARNCVAITSGARKRLRKLAKIRADKLKERAYRERFYNDPNLRGGASQDDGSSIGILLRNAADALGRSEHDVSIYVDRLREDWYENVDELNDMSLSVLSCYMPRRLAQKVHELSSSTAGFSKERDIELGGG